MIALAARLWDPDSGEIEIVDTEGRGVSLRQVADAELCDAVAVVEQDACLFHGTVREYVLRGTHGRTDEDLLLALDRVGARDWITLDDELGEHGARLSGGQRARLALARALCREPRILIVDEVTASLDPETERAISQVLSEVDATVIAASHRRETLARLDRVLRVDRPVVAATAGRPPSP